jgi:hypothetical protein
VESLPVSNDSVTHAALLATILAPFAFTAATQVDQRIRDRRAAAILTVAFFSSGLAMLFVVWAAIQRFANVGPAEEAFRP